MAPRPAGDGVASQLTELVADSILRPRYAARTILDLNISQRVLIEAGIAISAAAVVLSYLTLRLVPNASDPLTTALIANPLAGAALQFGMLMGIAFGADRIGRLFGGQGRFDGALALIVWLNTLLLAGQTVYLLILVAVPQLAGLLSLALMFWAFWAFASFVAELHDFESVLPVMGGILVTAMVMVLVVSMLLSMAGVTPQSLMLQGAG